MHSTANLYRVATHVVRTQCRRKLQSEALTRPIAQRIRTGKRLALSPAEHLCSTTSCRSTHSSTCLRNEGIPLYGGGKVSTEPMNPDSGPDEQKAKKDTQKPVTIVDIQKKYKKGKKLTMVTAYDYPSGLFADKAGVDMILVGDSLGMVVMGHSSTVPVTVDEIVHHCRAVRRGIDRCYLIGDMPFGSYLTVKDAVENAARIMKDGWVDSVKLEGGKRMINQIRAIVDCGISVVGHIGLTPQSASSLGGFRVQGRNASVAVELFKDALALQEAGVNMIVLECVPSRVAEHITSCLSVPTIGIGAGNSCSGQVQVFHDMMGMFDKFSPKFSKRYVDIGSQIQTALRQYCDEVKSREFPSESHSFKIKDEQFEKFVSLADAALEKDPKSKAATAEPVTTEDHRNISGSSRGPSDPCEGPQINHFQANSFNDFDKDRADNPILYLYGN